MNWQYNKPIFTSITPLSAAKSGTEGAPNASITLNWVYPTNFTDTGTHSSTNIKRYRLYRHIETLAPTASADGGPDRDPAYIGNQTDPEPRYRLVALLSNTAISYTDTFADLTMHAGEEISSLGDRWVDSAGNDVVRDIVETKRRVYYMLIAESNKMIFKAHPFLFIAHSNNQSGDAPLGEVGCRSTIRQLATSNTKLSTGVNPKITTGKINETFKALRENDLMFEAYTDSLESTPVNGQHYCKVCDQYCDCTEVDGDLICQTCNNKITEDNNESENDPALNTKVDEETLISLVDDPEELANHLSELKTESEDKLKSALNFLTTGGYTTALDRAISFAQER